MVRGIAVAAVLLSGGAALAEEPKPPVSLEAAVIPGRDRGSIPQLRVRLVGVAKGAAVVTDGLTVKVSRDGKTATVSLASADRLDERGRRIVPSADRLGVVRLEPGEVAAVHVPFSVDLREALTAAVAGEAELVVEYEVSEARGKRFGVVAGKLRATADVHK